MSEPINLIILGEPKAQKRHRSVRMGNFNRQYDPSAADKGDFLSIIQNKAPEKPFDCPLMVHFNFYFTRPQGHFKAGKNSHLLKDLAPQYHTGKPDSDNLIKFCMDAMNKVYWKDDGRICSLTASKQYSDNPRIEISINQILP